MAIWDFFRRKPSEAPKESNEQQTNMAAVTDEMLNNLALSSAIYSNKPPWLVEEKPPLRGTGLGALIAAEIARLVTIESKISIDNDFELNDTLQQYFMQNIRIEVEKGWALGGLVLKPYYKNADFELGKDGQIVSINGKLKIAFVFPSQFLIGRYDNSGTVSEISFFTTIVQDNKYYTLVEKQDYNEKSLTLTITNTLHQTHKLPATYRWDDLGSNIVPLSTVSRWQDILPKIVFPNVQGTLIGFYKPAVANNADINSPYGMSGLVRAAESIRRADLVRNALDWEVESSLARLFIDEISFDVDEHKHKKIAKYIVPLLGNNTERIFEKFSPEIRHESYLKVYNSYLRQTEDDVGLAHGTISDVNEVDKTATEYLMSRQRTQSTVIDNQKALEIAIRQLAYAMAVWNDPMKVIDFNDIKMSFDFDDSIVNSPAEQLQTALQLKAAGLIPGYKVIMTYYNCSEEDAKKLIQIARTEAFNDMNDKTENEFE